MQNEKTRMLALLASLMHDGRRGSALPWIMVAHCCTTHLVAHAPHSPSLPWTHRPKFGFLMEICMLLLELAIVKHQLTNNRSYGYVKYWNSQPARMARFARHPRGLLEKTVFKKIHVFFFQNRARVRLLTTSLEIWLTHPFLQNQEMRMFGNFLLSS